MLEKQHAAWPCALLLVPSLVCGQEPRPSPPSFAASTAAITVDVVVLDNDGQPVRGLTKADFSVFEDGRPQPIVGFEARALAISLPAGSVDGVQTDRSAGEPSARVFAILIDDLGLTSLVATRVKEAIGRWLREEAKPDDDITMVSASGDMWWSDEVRGGRGDLLAVLDRLRGKRPPPSVSDDAMTDVEAYHIVVNEGAFGEEILQRVNRRWTRTQACAPGSCESQIRMMAAGLQDQRKRRTRVLLLERLQRLGDDLAGLPGRKAVLLISEEFLDDTSAAQEFRQAIEAAQRGNTAVYFSGALGLRGLSAFSADQKDVGDLGAVGSDLAEATTGGERVAEDTGGVAVTTSNDLAEGLERMATDSSAYYLLGYQPEQLPDGKWHKLKVKVARPAVTVRARRGYFAGGDVAPAKKNKKEKKSKAASSWESALVAGGSRGTIPVRMRCHVLGPGEGDTARVLVVLEIDGERVRSPSLGLTILAMNRDRATVTHLVQNLVLSKNANREWWAFFREMQVPPGATQVRAVIREKPGEGLAMVTERLAVPNAKELYVSTPVISDTTRASAVESEVPYLVPTARRRFTRGERVYVQYEVYRFGREPENGARVAGGHALYGPDGRIVDFAPVTPIATDGTRVVRRIALPADRLTPGNYEIVLTLHDAVAERTLSTREAFAIDDRDSEREPTEPPAW